MGSALQDRKTPEGDENNRKNILETYSTIFLDSTGKEYARIEWVPPLKGAQPRISGFCFFAMIDWIPSEGRNPFRMVGLQGTADAAGARIFSPIFP